MPSRSEIQAACWSGRIGANWSIGGLTGSGRNGWLIAAPHAAPDDRLSGECAVCQHGGFFPARENTVIANETREQLANIVGEMREKVRDKLDSMEAEGITCIPVGDVRLILNEHYNLMQQLIYESM